MLDDARLLSAGAALTADVCIVGSGAAGITLARELRDSGLSVLLLESGDFYLDIPLQDLYAGQMTGIATWKLNEMRFRGAGGSTVLWAGYCLPLRPEDFTARSYIPGGGWPIGYDDLVPYYVRACQTAQIGTFQYDIPTLTARAGMPALPFDPAVLETRVYRFSPLISSNNFAAAYLDDLKPAEDVRWMTNANLLAIRLTGPGGSVSHLDCGTTDGLRFTVEATSYVIACGGIENARLLLASNLEQPEGVGNSSGLVGTFLEHPHYYSTASVLWDGAPPDLRFYDEHTALDDDGVTNVMMQGALSLPGALRASDQLPSFTATLETDFSTINGSTPITSAVASSVLPTPGSAQLTRLTLRCEQTFLDTGRITLTDDLDALGMRRIALNWQVADTDRAAVQRSFAYIGREIGRLGLGRVHLPQKDDAAWVTNPGGHHMGTTRMSADAQHGVVDPNLQTHDHPNLHVVGASTFASGGDSNPTLTVLALVHRLADHLKAGAQ